MRSGGRRPRPAGEHFFDHIFREVHLAHKGLSAVDDEQEELTLVFGSEKELEGLGKLRLACEEREVIRNGNARDDQIGYLPPFRQFLRVGASGVVAQKIKNGSGSPGIDDVATDLLKTIFRSNAFKLKCSFWSLRYD